MFAYSKITMNFKNHISKALAKIEAQARPMYDIIYWNMAKVILGSFITQYKSVDCI